VIGLARFRRGGPDRIVNEETSAFPQWLQSPAADLDSATLQLMHES
jgi:hypothetical protein